ncbi:hypothetical protein Mgra_00005560 [Meloidogyne graminicola]|uniref:Uncharacterized protein n=1 Tax=Meloidogyne graminicola TaxID=189291 RepID=A0A8S9ZNV1_9BILA|nr:hypothetical protein Mgra_00005560 [Meloidogyne graminicola]
MQKNQHLGRLLLCCNNEWLNCCRQRLLKDKNIFCFGLENEKSLKIGICLEKYFYGNETSIIETRAFNCCWQLYGEKCRQLCYLYLRSPTIPPEQKFTFTNKCLNNITNNNEELDCVLDRERILHECFPSCLHWIKNNKNSKRFRPSQYCEPYAKLMALESCHLPLKIFENNEN